MGVSGVGRRSLVSFRVLFAAVVSTVVFAPVLLPAAPDPLAELERANRGVRRFVLDNGMVCLVKEDHSAPVAAVQIWIRAGAMHEQEYLGGGLSHYVEHMIFKGTKRRGVSGISGDIDNAGGNINAYTALDRTVMHAELPSGAWRVGVDVLSDAVMNSVFPEEEWEKEKNVILREMAMNRDDPDRVLDHVARQAAFTAHPMRVPVIGYEDVFRQMGRKELLDYFRRQYRPDNMIAAVAGDVRADEVEAELRRIFEPFKRVPVPPVVLPAEPQQASARFARKTGKYNSTRIAVLFHAVPMCHRDMPALDVLALVAGQGASSRLVASLRDRLGLVHSIGAWSYTPLERGLFGVEAELDPANEKAVVAALEEEFARWRKGTFTKEEVAKAVRVLTASQVGALQSMGGQAGNMASDEYYAGDHTYSIAYLRAVGEVTPGRLKEVAAKYIVPENSTTAVLAPETEGASSTNAAAGTEPPAVRKTVLANGVPLLVREDHRLPFVHFCAVAKGGLLSEDSANTGITRLMANLLTRGAAGRRAEEIAAEYESIGASLSAFSGRSSFGLRGMCMSGDVGKFSQLFADCLLSPSFTDGELERYRTIQIADIRRQYESPMFLAQDALSGIIHTNHPYRWTEVGTEKTVAAMTVRMISDHYRAHVVAGNVAIAIFGDITEEQAVSLAEKRFGALPAGAVPPWVKSPQAPSLPARAVRTAPREQAIFLAGFPGVDIFDPRADCLNVLDTAMSGLSSDIGMEVREKRGLAYYVGASQRPGLEPGLFMFFAGTRKDAVGEVEKLVLQEMERVSVSGLRQEELDRARRQIIAAKDMSLQDNGAVAMDCALNELYGLGYDHIFKLEKRMEEITVEKLKSAAASILSTNRMAISIVLPESAALK